MTTEKEARALLARKRKDHETGRYTVAAICSACGHVERVGFAGWSALVCQGCQATINRTRYGREFNRTRYGA